MFAFSKTVKALEYRIIELERRLQKLEDSSIVDPTDIEEQVKEAIDGIDFDSMAENAIERVIDNASLQIRF